MTEFGQTLLVGQPDVRLSLDSTTNRIIVLGRTADHETIKSTLAEYEAGTPPDDPKKLVVYPVTSAQKTRFQALVPMLTEELPGVQVIADAEKAVDEATDEAEKAVDEASAKAEKAVDEAATEAQKAADAAAAEADKAASQAASEVEKAADAFDEKSSEQ